MFSTTPITGTPTFLQKLISFLTSASATSYGDAVIAISIISHAARTRASDEAMGSEGPYLRGRDNYGAVYLRRLEVLCDGKVLIGRARRSIDDQVVQVAPVYVPQELLDQPCIVRLRVVSESEAKAQLVQKRQHRR
jgi:hypothetical protein